MLSALSVLLQDNVLLWSCMEPHISKSFAMAFTQKLPITWGATLSTTSKTLDKPCDMSTG